MTRRCTSQRLIAENMAVLCRTLLSCSGQLCDDYKAVLSLGERVCPQSFEE